jgi:hypothetical protein
MRNARNKVMVILSTVFLMLGLGAIVTTATPAMAGTGNEYCMTPVGAKCVNAWSGGPFIKLYTGQGGGANSDFTVWNTSDGNLAIQFTGNSGWAGNCIGDAFNDSTRSDTSLDACALNGSGAGWGTRFTSGSSGCLPGYFWFKNNHWGGYLAPANSSTNGSPFLLTGSKTCFLDWPPNR